MASSFEWHGDKFVSEMQQKARKNVQRLGHFLVRDIKLSLNKPGPRKGNKMARASKPGEPPHRRTGRLARSIQAAALNLQNEVLLRIGTNVKYGLWLEFGTKKMAPRPFLRAALERNRKLFEKVMFS